jgi:uncharacterized protein with von Willebrand factor type A (vWA) domain
MQLGDARKGKLANNLIGFGRALRRAGLPVDAARITLAQQSCALVGFDQRQDLKAALEAVFVSRHTDRTVFGELFDAFFRNPEIAKQLMAQLMPQTKAATEPKRSPRAQEALAAPPPIQKQAKQSQPKEEEIKLDAAMSASAQQRLRHADFDQLSASEFKLVERLAREIPLSLPQFKSRRSMYSMRGVRIHWGRVLNEAGRFDGEVLSLPKQRRRLQPLPLLILVDVSGSMERYARLMLAFLHQSTRHLKRSVYAFGTQLTPLSAAFDEDDTDQMLLQTNAVIKDFGGGTQIGESMATFHNNFRHEMVGRRTLVLLISDGLDTGDLTQLNQHLNWLARQSSQLVWLNPLLRYDGYAPLAGGAQLIAKHAHKILAIHNLDSLEKLAHSLARVTSKQIHEPFNS